MNLKERQKLFERPGREYQGKPFWSWNGKLEEKELLRQIDIIKEMGFGGYFMHSRTGLEIEYLGEEWFDFINKCADYGKEKGMKAWLYDEDRWPSGSAGGMVTKEEKYRAMFMEMELLSEKTLQELEWDDKIAAVFACRQKKGIFESKKQLEQGEGLEKGETAVVFRLRYSVCNDNYNGYCYLNTMDREAVQCYIKTTHEKYKEKCGDRLGKEILGIFTDEPHRGGCFTNFAEGEVNAAPYTPGMFEEFEKRFGYSLKENLPELFLRRTENDLSKVKRDYFELCQELFLENFAIPIYRWCKENNMIFTGHVLHEDSLCSQAVMQGSLMRFYEYMEYPGVDVLCEDNRCYWIAKQIDSVARQLEKEWVLSELYGCTGWQMNFESYKNIGDWQALFGVNLRCPHLSWYTMKGEAKRDYPASILHQSSWYRHYHYVEDYYSRIHAALKGGKPECELLVLNPIESVWARAYSGSFDGLTAKDREIKRLEEQYVKVFQSLACNQIDFDYGEEDIMSRHGQVEEGVLYIGRGAYKKVLVAGMDTMRGSTLKLLKEFLSQGGTIIFAGAVPDYVDAEPSEEVKKLSEKAVAIPFQEELIAERCRSRNQVTIHSEGKPFIFARSRRIEEGRIVMILNVDRKNGYKEVTVNLGEGQFLELWDPRRGTVRKPAYQRKDGQIEVTLDLEAGGERLYLITDTERNLPEEKFFEGREEILLPDKYEYTRTESNVCVLDMAGVGDGNGLEVSCREVLKADRALRDYYGIPYRGGEMLQPWYQVKVMGADAQRVARLTVDYAVEVETLPVKVELAVEDLEHICKILVNEKEVLPVSSGKWIDICFDRIELPDDVWAKGHNTITLVLDYYKTSGLEAIYLLGDFGVQMKNCKPILTTLPKQLAIGDITVQGLPYYSGSILYHIDGCRGQKAVVTVEDFGGALVRLLGREDKVIAFPPYTEEVEDLEFIEVVLTRRNTFGPLHQIPKYAGAYGPGNFVTEGKDWEEDYVLYEQGLLKKPSIRR